MADLRAAAAQQREPALQRLRTLVELESPSSDAPRLEAVAAELAAGYGKVGGRPNTVNGSHLVVDWPAAVDMSPVLLLAHHDTVHPVGTLDSFGYSVGGDAARGPGVVDMKGSHVAVELAFRLLADHGLPLTRPVRLISVSDEEIGSPSGRDVVAEHGAGVAAVFALEAPLPGDRLKVGRRGVARIRVEVTGREAHSGLAAADGVSAIDELVDQLLALRDAAPPPGGDPGLNVGIITGGTTTNVVAGKARADVGLRFGTPAAEKRVLSAFDALRPIRDGAQIGVERLSHRPPWPAPDPDPLGDHVVAVAAGLGIALGRGVSGGAGDANHTGAAGLPTVDGLGPDGRGAHTREESVSITSLLDRAALLATLLTTSLPPL